MARVIAIQTQQRLLVGHVLDPVDTPGEDGKIKLMLMHDSPEQRLVGRVAAKRQANQATIDALERRLEKPLIDILGLEHETA
jgi:hypothetical protein